MQPSDSTTRLPRRTVIKWFAAATVVAQAGALENVLFGATSNPPPAGFAGKGGYGTDPKISEIYKPGDFWALTMTPAQRAATTALVDFILPADEFGPAASVVRVPDFLDEWVSAPYPDQRKDRDTLLNGLKWLDAEAQKRFKKDFAGLDEKQKSAIVEDICRSTSVKSEFKTAAAFFKRFRDLAAGAYYATPDGWKALGYVGNEATPEFHGPPPEVLERLGLTQTVK